MKALCPACRSELPPLPGVPQSRNEDVAAALERNEKIQAIKLVRELTSAGLKEAKDYVECPHPLPTSVRTPAPVDDGDPLKIVCPGCEQALPPIPGVPSSGLAEIAACLVRGEKIQAIKILRQFNSCGLKEAKDYVDCPHVAPTGGGAMSAPSATTRYVPIGCILAGVIVAIMGVVAMVLLMRGNR